MCIKLLGTPFWKQGMRQSISLWKNGINREKTFQDMATESQFGAWKEWGERLVRASWHLVLIRTKVITSLKVSLVWEIWGPKRMREALLAGGAQLCSHFHKLLWSLEYMSITRSRSFHVSVDRRLIYLEEATLWVRNVKWGAISFPIS